VTNFILENVGTEETSRDDRCQRS